VGESAFAFYVEELASLHIERGSAMGAAPLNADKGACPVECIQGRRRFRCRLREPIDWRRPWPAPFVAVRGAISAQNRRTYTLCCSHCHTRVPLRRKARGTLAAAQAEAARLRRGSRPGTALPLATEGVPRWRGRVALEGGGARCAFLAPASGPPSAVCRSMSAAHRVRCEWFSGSSASARGAGDFFNGRAAAGEDEHVVEAGLQASRFLQHPYLLGSIGLDFAREMEPP
jgi:hypothetical protein